jgi:predicted nucleotidyltransferase
MLAENIKNEIIENLQVIDPERVILFGSYAFGNPTPDSDIDLYVVTKEKFIPQTWDENLQIKKRVYLALGNFRKKHAADIIVHTLPLYEKFADSGSSFSKEILQKGIILI